MKGIDVVRCKTLFGAFALVSIVSAAHAQEAPRGRVYDRIRLELLRSPEVRNELAVGDDQAKEIEEALAPLLEPSGVTRGAQDLSPEERQKRFEEQSKKRVAANNLVAEKVDQILNHQQRNRLKQLWLQRLGAAALIQPEVVEEIGLTQKQQDKIRDIRKVVENHLQPASINPPPGQPRLQDFSEAEREQWLNELRVLREKGEVETLAVLSDEQKAKFAEMKGKEFEFPNPAGRGSAPRSPRRQQETKE